MTAAAACGDLNLGHKGVRGACTLIASPRKHPHLYICKRDFDPYAPLRAMGLVRRAVTPATRHDGSILDGFALEDYDLCVPGQQWTMVDLRVESLRLRPLLLATTAEDRRIAGEDGEVEPSTVLVPPAGTALLFSGHVTHAGMPVRSGCRHCFVASFSRKWELLGCTQRAECVPETTW